MNEAVWFRSHVERCLQQVWGLSELNSDADGDFPFGCGTSVGWVSPTMSPMGVRVWAYAALSVRRSAKLLTEVNDINCRDDISAYVVVRDRSVVVTQFVSAYATTEQSLGNAWAAVGTLADEIGPVLAAMFDGETPVSPSYPLPDSEEEETG